MRVAAAKSELRKTSDRIAGLREKSETRNPQIRSRSGFTRPAPYWNTVLVYIQSNPIMVTGNESRPTKKLF